MSSSIGSVDTDGNQDPIPWAPRKGRYLFPLCQYGRLSNQMDCMRRYFWMAAFLNRTLIIPRVGYTEHVLSNYKWRWDLLLNLPLIRNCLSLCCSSPAPAILTLDDYLLSENKTCLQLDRVFAYHKWGVVHVTPLYQTLGICPFHGRVQLLPWKQYGSVSAMLSAPTAAAAVDAKVISLGSMYHEMVKEFNFERATAPFRLGPRCGDIWGPNYRVLHLVDKLMKHFIGQHQSYAAVHLRRGDFFQQHGAGVRGILGLHGTASSVGNWLKPLNVSVLYIASDGKPMEMQNLVALLQDPKFVPSRLKIVRLHDFEPLLSSMREAKSARELEVGQGGIVMAVVEKYLCAHAKAFLGTPESTFSLDIRRIRLANHWASCFDSMLWVAS